MKFYRTGPEVARLRATGSSAIVLATDEVPRERVRLVAIDRATGTNRVVRFAALPSLLRAGDLVVVNDAATLPASIAGTTATGESFELRLSAPIDGTRLEGVLFGPGDHLTRTEDRLAPPRIVTGDVIALGALSATVEAIAGRRITASLRANDDAVWQALYAAGKPVQYAHRRELLPLYTVQTAYAARPWAAEMPSAGRALTWDILLGLRHAGVQLATLTHAAGLSSTGDDALDREMPWPERYELPQRTIEQVHAAKARGGRVIAIGTTVVRALESAAPDLHAGSGIATLRLDPRYKPLVVDGLVSGLHIPGESHFELLSAFAPRSQLVQSIALAVAHGMSGHELGDTCLVL